MCVCVKWDSLTIYTIRLDRLFCARKLSLNRYFIVIDVVVVVEFSDLLCCVVRLIKQLIYVSLNICFVYLVRNH